MYDLSLACTPICSPDFAAKFSQMGHTNVRSKLGVHPHMYTSLRWDIPMFHLRASKNVLSKGRSDDPKILRSYIPMYHITQLKHTNVPNTDYCHMYPQRLMLIFEFSLPVCWRHESVLGTFVCTGIPPEVTTPGGTSQKVEKRAQIVHPNVPNFIFSDLDRPQLEPPFVQFACPMYHLRNEKFHCHSNVPSKLSRPPNCSVCMSEVTFLIWYIGVATQLRCTSDVKPTTIMTG